MTDSEPKASSLERHSEFQTLTMLLTLITALNGEGKAILDMQSAPALKYYPALEKCQTKSGLVLNAIAALLVREHEIVAVVGSKLPLSASDSINIDGSDSPPNPEEPLNIVAFEEDSNIRFTDIPFEDIKNSNGHTTFAALANRRDDDHLTSDNSDASSCILVKGTSHWLQISTTNPWHGLSLRQKSL